MAGLPDFFQIAEGQQFIFDVTASFSPADAATDWTIGTPTDVPLTQNALANNAGRQSDKMSFGVDRAEAYACFAAADFTGKVPIQGNLMSYLWLPSVSNTQGTGNIAGNSGADASAPGGALGSLLIGDFVDLAIPIGVLRIHDGVAVQNGFVGILFPPSQYGQMLVFNESGDALMADDVENHVVLNPLVRKVEDTI